VPEAFDSTVQPTIMKTKRLLFSLAAVLLFATNAAADPDPNFFIYLCFGQSNMESGGKMDEIGRTVDERFLVMAELAKTHPCAYVISSAGCSCHPDHLHFNSAGSREFGKQYAETLLSLPGYQIDEPK
jgi:hypothetical protein